MGRDLGRLVDSTKKVAEANAEAFGIKQQKTVDRLTGKLEDQQVALKKSSRNLEGLLRQYDAIKNAEVTPASLKRLETELGKVQKEVKKAGDEYDELLDKFEKAVEIADFDKQARGFVSPENAAEVDRISAELDKASDKFHNVSNRASELQSTVEKIKLDPTQTEEAQKLADRIKTAEDGYNRLAEKTQDTANQLGDIVSNSELFASPFEKALSAIEKESAEIAERVREQQREYGGLLRLYEKAEQALESVKQSGDQAAISLAEANMDRLIGDIDEAKDGNEALAYQASLLKERLNELSLNPNNADEAEELGSKIADIAVNLNNCISGARDFNREIHDAWDFGDEAEENTSRLSKALDVVVGKLSKIKVAFTKIVAIPAAITKGVLKLIGGLKKLTSGINKTNKSAGRLSGTFGGLHKRLLRIASAVFVFNVLRKALRGLQDYLSAVMRTNQQFVNSLASVKGNLLTAFQPIYEAILPALNALAAALAKVTAYLAAFINFLFGKSAAASQDAAKSLYNQAKALDATGKAAKDAAGKLAAFDEINVLATENADEATGGGSDVIAPDFDYDLSLFEDFFNQFESWPEAFREMGKRIAESINGFLSGIDWDAIHRRAELIAESIASFLNGAIENLDWELVGQSLGQGINTVLAFAEKFIDTFNWRALSIGLSSGLNSLAATINWQGISQTFYKGLNSITDAFVTFFKEVDWSNIGNYIVHALNSVIVGIDWITLGGAIAAPFQSLIELLYPIVTNFDWRGLGDSLGAGINSIISGIDFGKAAGTISAGIVGILNSLSAAIKSVNWRIIGNEIYNFIINVDWSGIVRSVFEIIGTAIGAFVSLLYGIIEDAVWSIVMWWAERFFEAGGNIPKGLWNGIKEGLGNIFMWIKENIFDPFINGFKSLFGIHSPSTVLAQMGIFLIQGLAQGIQNTIQMVINIFRNLWDSVKNLTAEAWEKVKEIWSVVSGWFNETVVQPVSIFFSGLWEAITNFASNAWENIKNVWNSVTGWFDDNIITPLTGAFKGFINGILGFFESMANGVIGVFESLVNWIVDAINSISFDLPKILGGGHIGFNIPKVSLGRVSIPKLATGAVIPPNSEFLAILGDQKSGRNIEAPEGLFDEKLAPIYDAIEALSEAMQNNTGGGQPVILQIDGNTILTAVINAQEKRGRGMISGKNLALV